MPNSRYPDLDLDLTFKPVDCPEPNCFTPEQIAQYNELGYIADVPLFEGEAWEMLRARLKKEGDSLPGLNPHVTDRWIYDIVTDPRLLAYVQELLGANIICHISQYIDKKPGSLFEVAGHQDAAFNAMDARSVIAWIAVDDANTGNGCMNFVPGSHLLGALEVVDKDSDLNAERQVCEQAVARLGTTPVEVKAGHAVFFSDLMLHISPPNPSLDRARPAFTQTFTPAEVMLHPHPSSNNKPVLCCGENVHGNWTLIDPPE